MVMVPWLIWMPAILVLQMSSTTGIVSGRQLSNLSNDATSIDVNISTSEHHATEINEDHPVKYHRQKRHQRRSRSLANTTDTTQSNETRDANQNDTKPTVKAETATLPPPLIQLPTFKLVKHVLPPVQFPTATISQTKLNCRGKISSCSKKCSNATAFIHYSIFKSSNTRQKCNCDPACNEIFMDCCHDYAKECKNSDVTDEADDVYSHKLQWRCVRKLSIVFGACVEPRDIWMIAQCPHHWPDDDIKNKCHSPPTRFEVKSFTSFVPVVGSSNKLTYRNQYCAQCNNVANFEFWEVNFKKVALPPFYTPEELTKFLSRNLGHYEGVSPNHGQLIRWCHYPNVVSTCAMQSHGARGACLNGTVSLVKRKNKVYKNEDCALCNGVKETCGVTESETNPCSVDPHSISRAISLRDYGVSLETRSCARDQVYDPYLGKCRQSYEWSELEKGARDKYQVTLTLAPRLQVFQLSTLKKELASYFKMNDSQINIKDIKYFVKDSLITFTLQLTPSQSLIVATDAQLLGNTNETMGLRRIFKFQEAFKLSFNWVVYTVYRLRVRQEACIHRRLYRFGEYTILDDLRIRVNSTGAVYEQVEYFMNTNDRNPNVTVCLKVVPIACDGEYINLTKSEYNLTSNLTLVHKSLKYNFGDYYYDNGTAFICVEYKKTYTISTAKKVKDDLALVILTWIGFIVSIICLLALVVTYSIFQELRTLPGKNLISLSLSLCLAEILWLCGSSAKDSHDACTVIAIANHHFFLVFFTASSVVAFHSCVVFGKQISFRRSKSEQKKMFFIYSFVAWGFPALFVLVFALLDHWRVFVVDYGEDICWLGTKESKIFLFIVPFGVLLLFNLCLFVFVAVRLYKSQKSRAKALHQVTQHQTQNIVICVKLSSLMGFSWLFGLLQVAVETKTDVFSYLFVIFVSFQGLFICAAFLFKRNCYQLYSNLISRNSNSGSGSVQNRPSNKNNFTNYQDTKL